MVNKIIFSLLLILSVNNVFSQAQEVDLDIKLKAAVLDPDSPRYYPVLFARYEKGDTTLTKEDFRHLYYGYVYQDSYTPLESNIYSDSLMMTLQLSTDGTIAADNYDKVIYYGSKVLESRPFDISVINFMTYCLQNKGESERAQVLSYNLGMIVETILSSGSGESDKSPWHVLYREDPNDILGLLGLTFFKRMYITTTIEYFQLTKKHNGNKGYYFDVSNLYIKPPKKRENQQRRMEFNPYTNPRSDKFQSPQKSY